MSDGVNNELSSSSEEIGQIDTTQSIAQVASSLSTTLAEIDKQKKELRNQGTLVRLGFIIALLALVGVVVALLIDIGSSLRSDVQSRETLIQVVQQLDDKIK